MKTGEYAQPKHCWLHRLLSLPITAGWLVYFSGLDIPRFPGYAMFVVIGSTAIIWFSKGWASDRLTGRTYSTRSLAWLGITVFPAIVWIATKLP